MLLFESKDVSQLTKTLIRIDTERLKCRYESVKLFLKRTDYFENVNNRTSIPKSLFRVN